MNRTIKDATVKRFPYDGHEQLRRHLADFIAAYDYGADPRPSRDLRPTKTSANGGPTNPNALPSTRSSQCRDETPRAVKVHLSAVPIEALRVERSDVEGIDLEATGLVVGPNLWDADICLPRVGTDVGWRYRTWRAVLATVIPLQLLARLTDHGRGLVLALSPLHAELCRDPLPEHLPFGMQSKAVRREATFTPSIDGARRLYKPLLKRGRDVHGREARLRRMRLTSVDYDEATLQRPTDLADLAARLCSGLTLRPCSCAAVGATLHRSMTTCRIHAAGRLLDGHPAERRDRATLQPRPAARLRTGVRPCHPRASSTWRRPRGDRRALTADPARDRRATASSGSRRRSPAGT